MSFRAAYGNERVTAYLFLPKNADPPFQTVVTFPGTYALDIRSSARLETQWFDFIIRSGRAVVHPIYNGTYERTIGGTYTTYTSQPGVWRELLIQWHKDLGTFPRLPGNAVRVRPREAGVPGHQPRRRRRVRG